LKRLLSLTLLFACAVSGAAAAYAFADDTPPAPTTTTVTTTTTTVVPEGVTVGGVAVGGLAPTDAVGVLRASFGTPLVLRIVKHTFAVAPGALATPAYVQAVERALSAQPNESLRLGIVVNHARVRALVAKLARRYDAKATEPRLLLRHLRPFITKARPGLRIVRWHTESVIATALGKGIRDVTIPVAKHAAQVSPLAREPIIVIRRGENHLFLYRGTHYVRRFGVATGQSAYPTPLGSFEIVVKWRNPWWYPPAAPWAVGEKPTPPGPGNPLGTRWMGLSASGVGIHGTNNESSIGYSVSHGCIRMHVSDAEWLFEHVEIGTPVFIVSA
jgi:lipoprotein-anchoring transpeptidase ErfK/SrfK